MPAKNKDRVKKFYKEVFGWKMNQLGTEMGHYLMAQTTPTDKNGMIKTPGAINGGFFQKDSDNEPPHVVIAVDDIKKHIEIIKKSKGKVLGKPMDIPGVGLFAIAKDTEGNPIGILQPSM